MTSAATLRQTAPRDYVVALFAQSGPLLLGQLAASAYGVIDLLLLGRLSEHAMAVFGVSWNIFNTLQIGFTGVLIALIPMVSRLHGAGLRDDVAQAVRQGIWLALLLSLPICTGLLLPGGLLALGGQGGQSADEIRHYLAWLALSVPPMLLFRVASGYASAILDTRKVLYANLIGLALKGPLSLLLVLGGPGFAGLGVAGCAISTAIVTWGLLAAGMWILARDKIHGGRQALTGFSWPRLDLQRALLKQGIPIGLSFFFDYSALTIIGLLVARGGPTQTAAHGIAANVSYLCYLVPMSMSNVASAMVGQARGRHNGDEARRVGNLSLATGSLASAFIAAVLALAAGGIARLYTSNEQVASYAATLIASVAAYHLFDAVFTIGSGVLRGHERTLVPTLVLGGTLWGIGLGGGLLWSHGVDPARTAVTFWTALALAAVAAASGVVAYYRRVVRQERTPSLAALATGSGASQ